MALVIWLGFHASEDNSFILWFGLASALVAPVGLGLVGYAFFGSDREDLQMLAKVPEIRELMEKAESEEERIHILEKEREQLDIIVRYEAEKMALESRKRSLEVDAVRILNELDSIDEQSRELDLIPSSDAIVEEIQRLRDRLEANLKGDIVIRFRKGDFIIRRSYVDQFPYFGDMLYQSLKTFSNIQQRTYRKRITKKVNPSSNQDVNQPRIGEA